MRRSHRNPGRTSRTSTRLAVLAVTAVVGASTVGCGVVGQVGNVIGAAGTLSDFADRLGKSSQLTYTAVYEVSGGGEVTMVQQPPSSAFVGPQGRYVFTPEHMLLCEGDTCTRTANAAGAAPGIPSAVVGPGFVTPELALGLIGAAALVPGAHVTSGEKEIAGQKTLCAHATGLEAAASPGETDAPRDFSVCVTESGVLASFQGTQTNGEKAGVTLVRFSAKADPAAFEVPAGVEVRDADALTAG